MESVRASKRRRVFRQLWFWVVVAIGAGAVFGLVAPGAAKEAKWLADAFLQLVKTITAPVIFLTVVIGIASLGNMARAGGLAARALGYRHAESLEGGRDAIGVGAVLQIPHQRLAGQFQQDAAIGELRHGRLRAGKRVDSSGSCDRSAWSRCRSGLLSLQMGGRAARCQA
jgi:Na+/H+-dicarboxylate symporter